MIAAVAATVALASVRLAQSYRGRRPAGVVVEDVLDRVIAEEERNWAAPTLLLLVDLECGACESALADLRFGAHLGDFGVRAGIVLRGDPANRSIFDSLGRGVLPAYVLLDAHGEVVAVLRGYRPPRPLRAWLREALAGDYGPESAPFTPAEGPHEVP